MNIIKKIFITLLLMLSTFSLISCSRAVKGTPTNKNNSSAAVYNITNNEDDNINVYTNNDISNSNNSTNSCNITDDKDITEDEYILLKNNEIPSELALQIEELKDFKGYIEYTQNNEYYTVLLMGQQATSGFCLNIEDLKNNDDHTKIQLHETKPDKDDMVTQNITYPYIVIKLKNKTSKLYVINSEGEEYMKLNIKKLKLDNREINNNTNKDDYESNIEFEAVSYDETPEKINNIINQYKDFQGYYNTVIDDYNYIVVFLGMKTSGGYGVEVVSVNEKEDKIEIVVSKRFPDKKKMYITALTYPYTVIRFKSDIKDFVVTDTGGNEYQSSVVEK
jgi:protease stability complex PrcB-like protein